MKWIIPYILLGMSVVVSNAQQPVLFGTTSSGNGGIFRFDSKDNALNNVYRFKNSGIYNYSKMVYATNGLIYGVADGGPYGYGIIYSLDPVTLNYKIEKNFKLEDGEHPFSLVQGKDGKLYGTTDRGGPADAYLVGVLFSFDPTTSVFEVLVNIGSFAFNTSELTAASDGLLYGVAQDIDKVFIYSFNPQTRAVKEEADFSEGIFRQSGAMIEGPGGILYGVIPSRDDPQNSDSSLPGQLFSYSLNSKKINYLFDFNAETGQVPQGTLLLGSDDKFYSIAINFFEGSIEGKIFCFDPNKNSMKVIHDFDGVNGGSIVGGLTEGPDGKLYAMTTKTVSGQSSDNFSTVFYSLDKSGDNYKVLRNFDKAVNSQYHSYQADLILVGNKLFGIAAADKTIPYSYIFSYQSSTDLFQKIIQTSQDKGLLPSNLLQAMDGRFYGVTTHGGAFERGGLFSFNPATHSYAMLMPFNKERGMMPEQGSATDFGLVQAGNGKIFGLAPEGGADNAGVIFCYDPNTARYTVLKNFTSDYVRLIGFGIGNDGNLYSSLFKRIDEFTFGFVVFSVNTKTGRYKEVIHLDYDDGPFGIFMPASDGKLYACTPKGVFDYDAKANVYHITPYPDQSINRFSQRLVEASDHKLYGKVSPFDDAIYSFDPSDGSFSELYSFEGGDNKSYSNFSDLLFASDGLFYATTYITSDFQRNLGTMFTFNPVNKSFNLIRDFDQNTGGNPLNGPLVELNTSIPPIVSITDQKKFEGETAQLTVSLNRISMEPITLNYQTVPGTANEGGKNPDYTATSGQVVIPPGEISTTISVALLEDELMENRETFTVLLQKAAEGLFQLGDSIGVINIKNGSAPVIPPGGEIITIPPKPGDATGAVVNDRLVVRTTPNPTSGFFTLHISGRSSDRLSVTVTNLSGQIMDKFNGASKNAEFVFGQNYQCGSYFVRIVEGKNTKVIKLVKLSR